VDFEERVSFARCTATASRGRAGVGEVGLGAMLCFDQYNIRYISSTVIGEWARDKLIRYTLLTGTGDPWVWDFGSAARHHRSIARGFTKITCWPEPRNARRDRSRSRLFKAAAKGDQRNLKQEGVADMPLGLDFCEPPCFCAAGAGIEVRDGQQMMLLAREIKNHDEITLLNIASSMVDGVYQDIAEELKPGVKESQIVALATKRLYEMGSDCVEAINSISGERCSPHPHNFTDRLIRPGDPAVLRHHSLLHGYRTCYYRTFTVGSSTQPQRDAYKRRSPMDGRHDRDAEAGLSTDKAAEQLPKAFGYRFRKRDGRLRSQLLSRLGLGLHERPLISRLNSFIEPYELKAGMVFAVETFCPATDGFPPPASKRWSCSHRRRQNHLAVSGKRATCRNRY
jgi:Xaa-Pro dipeptidase